MTRTEPVELMPVIGLRLLEGRVGSTLMMSLLASSTDVVCDRRYPLGEYRYLSYCMQVATRMGTPFDPERDTGVTEMLFGTNNRGGPLPWTATSLSVEDLGPRVLRGMWGACSSGFREYSPNARWYAEKLAYPADLVIAAGIPLQLIDIVRDPRDMVASMISFGARSGPWGFGRTPGDTDEQWLTRRIEHFEQQLDVLLAPCTAPRLLLRYEDFATDLTGCAPELGARFGLQLDAPAVLRDRPDHHVTTDSVDASIGRWKSDLPEHLADTIWERLAPRLELLGYHER